MAVTLRHILEDDLDMIMNWRMSESVTKYMNTNPKLTHDGQIKWLEKIRNDDSVRNWMIQVDGQPAGVISLIDMDRDNGNTSWGYYIGEEKLRSLSTAISLEMSLYDYCFDYLGLNEVHNEVFKLNEGVWKLHLACGNKIVKEVEKEVEKEGELYDIVHLSIERDEWYRIRDKKRYEKISFDIFNDKIGGMELHHLGVAVKDIEKAIKEYRGLGWYEVGDIVDDLLRNVKIVFMKRQNGTELIELVAPLADDSPVSNTLKIMKNVTTPYHYCYEVQDLDVVIKVLKARKYVLVDNPKEAVAFSNRRVAFLLKKDAGLIELLEECDYE